MTEIDNLIFSVTGHPSLTERALGDIVCIDRPWL